MASAPAQTADPQTIAARIDLAITLVLHTWPALTLAVRSELGGPDSGSKRDWLAGALSDLFSSRPGTTEEDVEDMLLQVLEDEFECELDDGSEVVVAREIVRLRAECMKGEFGEVDQMWRRWMEGKGRREAEEERLRRLQVVEHRHGDGNDEDDEDEDDEDDEDQDVEMGEEDGAAAPALQPRRQKQEPEVDEEGFTTVKRRGR